MPGKELVFFRIVFVAAALWNLIGGLPGYFDAAAMFEREFGYELTDPVMLTIYRGAWGTTFLYFIGYLIVAYRPIRHTGIVILGGVGKAFFALNVLGMYLKGLTTAFALIVVAGDLLFVSLFIIYFIRLRKYGHPIL